MSLPSSTRIAGLVLRAGLFLAAGTVAVNGVLAPTAQAAEVLDKAALLDAVSKKYTSVKTIRASVTQTSHNPMFGTETVQAKLVVKQPGKFRWATGGDKVATLFVTNGVKMWVYTAEDKQVIEYEDVSANRSSAEMLLTSLDKLEDRFQVELLTATADGYELALKPKADEQFKRVVIGLAADLTVKRVSIVDTFDNKTDLDFQAVELNPTVDDAQFVFTAPSGVDVIRGN